MSKSGLTKFTNCFSLPNPDLRRYFGSVVKGQPKEYRTTFAGKEVPPSRVVDEWKSTLESIRHEWPTLWKFENDLAEKVGPMSIRKPLSERMADIESYYEGILLPSAPISTRAVKAVEAEFRSVRGLRMRSQQATVENMRLSTNSGSPFYDKRRHVVSKTVPCLVGNGQQVLPSGTWDYCAILGWRGQEGGPDPDQVKQRVVWMFPMAVNVLELQVYQVLIAALQRRDLVPAWVSMEAVDAKITEMFDSKDGHDLVVCTDFSAFDQHFNSSLSSVSKSLLEYLFVDSDDTHRWLETVFPIKYHIPLAYDWGALKTGEHGMGSGSGGTNADETLAHRALQYEAAIRNGKRLNLTSQCLGDDGLLTYPGIKVEDVVDSYTAHGLVMNEIKQYASTQDCTYLRRWHHVNYRIGGVCVGVYSTCRAIGRLCEQERYYSPEVWGPKAVALRQLSIIENCKWHPLFEQFVDFCMKRDVYRLGLDIPNFLDNLDQYVKEINDYMPDFLGYTK